MSMRLGVFAVVFMLAFTSLHACAAVWYVDIDNTSGTENGTSWATAFNTIQEGIDGAYNAGGGEVRVAEGVYNEERSSCNAAHGDHLRGMVLYI